MPISRRAPLLLELTGDGRYADWFINEDGLHSWRRVEPLGTGSGRERVVKQWTWSLNHHALLPTYDGKRCVDVRSQRGPVPCT